MVPAPKQKNIGMPKTKGNVKRKFLKCNLCNISVNSAIALSDHEKGSKHFRKVQETLKLSEEQKNAQPSLVLVPTSVSTKQLAASAKAALAAPKATSTRQLFSSQYSAPETPPVSILAAKQASSSVMPAIFPAVRPVVGPTKHRTLSAYEPVRGLGKSEPVGPTHIQKMPTGSIKPSSSVKNVKSAKASSRKQGKAKAIGNGQWRAQEFVEVGNHVERSRLTPKDSTESTGWLVALREGSKQKDDGKKGTSSAKEKSRGKGQPMVARARPVDGAAIKDNPGDVRGSRQDVRIPGWSFGRHGRVMGAEDLRTSPRGTGPAGKGHGSQKEHQNDPKLDSSKQYHANTVAPSKGKEYYSITMERAKMPSDGAKSVESPPHPNRRDGLEDGDRQRASTRDDRDRGADYSYDGANASKGSSRHDRERKPRASLRDDHERRSRDGKAYASREERNRNPEDDGLRARRDDPDWYRSYREDDGRYRSPREDDNRYRSARENDDRYRSPRDDDDRYRSRREKDDRYRYSREDDDDKYWSPREDDDRQRRKSSKPSTSYRREDEDRSRKRPREAEPKSRQPREYDRDYDQKYKSGSSRFRDIEGDEAECFKKRKQNDGDVHVSRRDDEGRRRRDDEDHRKRDDRRDFAEKRDGKVNHRERETGSPRSPRSRIGQTSLDGLDGQVAAVDGRQLFALRSAPSLSEGIADSTVVRRIPKEYLQESMPLSEWRELREMVMSSGNDVDILAYKMLQELLLSPLLGVDASTLAPFSRNMLSAVREQFVSGKSAWARCEDFPNGLWQREKRYREEDDAWKAKLDDEELAVHNMMDNMMYAFYNEEDQVLVMTEDGTVRRPPEPYRPRGNIPEGDALAARAMSVQFDPLHRRIVHAIAMRGAANLPQRTGA